ncbi:MAG: outer membrane receptor for ferrienterochelin and colicins [Polaribacter sp.]|jgi:outer membrane receptor for ferrienterochelin and colicins
MCNLKILRVLPKSVEDKNMKGNLIKMVTIKLINQRIEIGLIAMTLFSVLIVIGVMHSPLVFAQSTHEEDVLASISLEGLLNLKVSSASGIEESYRDAPAAMVIITALDIKQRGYTSFDEIVLDLPGFDTSATNGNGSITTYQRGYRTPLTQRTLLLINGITDNHLWTHEATLTKTYPLSNIERIEVLYGPAGAFYGPNAFLGIINIITKDSRETLINEDVVKVNTQIGSYNTQSIDMTAAGNHGEFSYNFSAKYYSSDEAGINDYAPWGYLSNDILSNREIWGPVVYDTALAESCDNEGCPHQSSNEPYGNYSDRSRDWGVLADIGLSNFKLGVIAWEMKEGYGPYYPSDRAQPGSYWNRSSQQLYLEHEKSDIEKIKIKTLALYRESRIWGSWAEALPGSTALSGANAYSSVSISDWNSISNSWLFKQDYTFEYSENLTLTGGVKYERKELTKSYDLCSYWADAFCSSATLDSAGKGIASSTDNTIDLQLGTLSNMPSDNLASTIDKGIYIQGIWGLESWRINTGIRYDKNSLYGSTINPRASVVYYLSDLATVKLLYGQAFQEPAPIQLWGGWSGRAANSNLSPEKTENFEAIFMYQQGHWLHDISIFSANFDSVIKEEAENAGQRNTFGIEYRGSFQFSNFIDHSADITGYIYYTYTTTKSSVSYDHTIGQWVGEGIASCQQTAQDNTLSYDPCSDLNVNLGDIAPHKINAGINVPLGNDWNINIRTNWVDSKALYVRNPLRNNGRKNNAYIVFDTNIIYEFKQFYLALKVKNMLNKDYYHSGVEGAESGDDFSKRSQGWRNSLIPQTGRNFMLTLSMHF